MFEKIGNMLKRLGIKKENLIPFIVFLVLIFSAFIVAKIFNFNLTGVLLVYFLILFSIFCIAVWFWAGITFFRSLIVSSVSLSLVILLAKTYCDLPIAFHSANDALKSLFGFGLVYSTLLFIGSLKKELLGDKEKKGSLQNLEEMYGGKKPWLILFFYALFIGFFLWQLYQIIASIIRGLCIY